MEKTYLGNPNLKAANQRVRFTKKQVEEFLRGQLKKEDLPEGFQALAVDLKNEIKNIMKEFQKALPKKKEADDVTKSLEKCAKMHENRKRPRNCQKHVGCR